MQQSFEFIVLIREKSIDMYGKITRISFQTRLHFMSKMDIYSLLTVLYNKTSNTYMQKSLAHSNPNNETNHNTCSKHYPNINASHS